MSMAPPIFRTVNVSAVQALLKTGNGPLRVYSFGEAPQDGPTPYAVWQTIYGSPENLLDKVPDSDAWGVQIDVYTSPEQGAALARNVAQALRDALEPVAYVTSWRGESRDQDTKHFRYSFDVDWLTYR